MATPQDVNICYQNFRTHYYIFVHGVLEYCKIPPICNETNQWKVIETQLDKLDLLVNKLFTYIDTSRKPRCFKWIIGYNGIERHLSEIFLKSENLIDDIVFNIMLFTSLYELKGLHKIREELKYNLSMIKLYYYDKLDLSLE